MSNPSDTRTSTRQSPEVYRQRRINVFGTLGIVAAGALTIAVINASYEPKEQRTEAEVASCAQADVDAAVQNEVTQFPLGMLEDFVVGCSDAGTERGGSFLSGETVTSIALSLDVTP